MLTPPDGEQLYGDGQTIFPSSWSASSSSLCTSSIIRVEHLIKFFLAHPCIISSSNPLCSLNTLAIALGASLGGLVLILLVYL
jgi:hypothetical protein